MLKLEPVAGQAWKLTFLDESDLAIIFWPAYFVYTNHIIYTDHRPRAIRWGGHCCLWLEHVHALLCTCVPLPLESPHNYMQMCPIASTESSQLHPKKCWVHARFLWAGQAMTWMPSSMSRNHKVLQWMVAAMALKRPLIGPLWPWKAFLVGILKVMPSKLSHDLSSKVVPWTDQNTILTITWALSCLEYMYVGGCRAWVSRWVLHCFIGREWRGGFGFLSGRPSILASTTPSNRKEGKGQWCWQEAGQDLMHAWTCPWPSCLLVIHLNVCIWVFTMHPHTHTQNAYLPNTQPFLRSNCFITMCYTEFVSWKRLDQPENHRGPKKESPTKPLSGCWVNINPHTLSKLNPHILSKLSCLAHALGTLS